MYLFPIDCLILQISCIIHVSQWRNQEFQKRGPGPDAVELSWDCFDAPSQTSHALVVRVENKIHIVEIECGLQLKYMHFMHSKYTQIKRKLKGEGGGAPGAPVLDHCL